MCRIPPAIRKPAQILTGLLLCALPLAAVPSVQWITDPDHPRHPHVEARLPEGLAPPGDLRAQRALLTISVATGPSATPMAGSYSAEQSTLRFRPAFPLEPGLTYVATLDLAPDHPSPPPATFTIDPPAQLPPAARVAKITPSAEILPFNLLKFYIHFSAPMTRGDVYRHIVLRDQGGKPVADPFLELPEELWNPEMTRLTVLLDPGRIKRGLLPHEIVGDILLEGSEYSLSIDPAWKDASGQPLATRAEKSFRAGPADYTQPDPAKWHYQYPAAGSKAALAITFTEPLDAALVSRLIVVRDDSGRPVSGTLELLDAERRWKFTPDHSWKAARYEIHIDHRIEDLAGNSIERPFEEGLDRHPDRAGAPVDRTVHPFTPETGIRAE